MYLWQGLFLAFLYKNLLLVQINIMLGISRRLDQLGRIVLPIEIRKKLKLEEGSLIDISLSQDCVILKKREPVLDLKNYVHDICSCFNCCDIVCLSESKLVYSCINGKANTIENKDIGMSFFDSINKQNDCYVEEIKVNEDIVLKNKFAYFLPIITYGDKHGYICFFYNSKADEKQIGVMNFICNYISGKL